MIQTENLTRHYGTLAAVQDLNLIVEQGELFGFLGPNGAGKTTTMRILTTLIMPTTGAAQVAGYSVTDYPREVRRAIRELGGMVG